MESEGVVLLLFGSNGIRIYIVRDDALANGEDILGISVGN